MIIEGQSQAFQRFSSSKLVLNVVESCFEPLNHCENGSTTHRITIECQFQVFQQLFSGKLVLKHIESRYTALYYLGAGQLKTVGVAKRSCPRHG
jgi:hypothetical protein